eukprot:scaffold799_cov220-Pinguiococcus_pyrenoidosus.AAC.2
MERRGWRKALAKCLQGGRKRPMRGQKREIELSFIVCGILACAKVNVKISSDVVGWRPKDIPRI